VEHIIAGIDVGSTKVCALVGRVTDNGALHIIGMGVVPAKGVRRGVVTDIEEAAEAIGQATQRAQRVAGVTITEAYLSIGGAHVSSQNSRGAVAIGRGDRPIDRDDIARVMESAEAIAVPHNRTIIHSIPREYILDGQRGIRNPLGLLGYRLEVEAHIVTASASCVQNLRHCVEMNDVRVIECVFQPIASAMAVLTEEECRMGVVLVDIGGGTTDLAIYLEGSVWETLVHEVGGNHITNDIAVILRTPFGVAEDLKIRYAHTRPRAIEETEQIEISTFGEDRVRTIARRELCQIVEARTDEVFDMIARDIRRSGLTELLPAGVVITGGTANLRGIAQIATEKLALPVRIGIPRGLHGLVESLSSPAYSTSVGLLVWGQRQLASLEDLEPPKTPDTFWGMLGKWLKNLLPS